MNIKLAVKGIGHVPSFKNSKMIVTRPRPRLMTNPKRQAWMCLCEAVLESELRSLYQTTENATSMARSLRSWIACVAPLNDSVKSIPEINVSLMRVEKGLEGFEIEIEEIL